MATLWMRLDAVPATGFVPLVAAPMLRSLAARGVHANLTPTRDVEIDGRTDLAYALYPAGELGFIYTTGPTRNAITGEMDEFRHMLATITGLPHDAGVTEAAITRALGDFESAMRTRGLLADEPDATPGCSFAGRLAPEAETRRKGACFVATAVYGGYDAPQVRVFRRFRDDALAATPAGRAAVGLYYLLSPALARRLAGPAATLVRAALDPLAAALRRAGFSDGPYLDAGRR